ncbi:MAG: response regulator [Desulfobacterales bacterium]|nr:response regulator [Desulfobacterales bacterium]
MSVITVFSGSYCKETDVIGRLQEATGYELIADSEIVAEAGRLSGLSEGKIARCFSAKTSIFDKFGREKKQAVIFLKSVLAKLLSRDKLLIAGFCGQLIPKPISHILRVCLIADMKHRIALAVAADKITEKEAIRLINKKDEDRVAWTLALFEKKDPWDGSFYDMVLPMDKIAVSDAVGRIAENAAKAVVQPTERSQQAVADFMVEARVEQALFKAGHSVDVATQAGQVTLTINRNVLRFKRLENELRKLVGQVPGAVDVQLKIGKKYHKSNIYRRHDFSLPDRVLLVDDEREFAESLSERLTMQDIDAAVTYDGSAALDLISEEEPEVMLLDLNMPGINGMEVLKQVKTNRPEVEVIIMTAHGSEAERKRCMELGAFAFLQKPVDPDILSETLRRAKKKIRRNIARQS